jgi:hypothetical protein
MNLVFPGQPDAAPLQPVFHQPKQDYHGGFIEIAKADNPYDMAPVKAALEPYLAKIDGFAESANAIEITDAASQDTAVEMAGQAKRLGKNIEAARKQFVDAPNDYVKQVNGLAKGIIAKLDGIENGIKRKMGDYQREVERKRLAAEAEARKAAIEAQRLIDEEARLARETADKVAAEAARIADEAAKAGNVDAARLAEVAAAEAAKAQVQAELPTVQVEAPFIPQSSGPVRTAEGTASIKKVWKFEVTDAQAVPREYLVVDERAIRQAVAAGVRAIAGVNIFEESQVAIRA